jgi:hypothetical protein
MATETDQIRSEFKTDINPAYLSIVKKDSFPLAQDADFIFDRVPELSSSLFKNNKQFVISRPDLIVGLMDTTGHFLRKITERGDGPGQLIAARSAKVWADTDGDIYVLTNGNAYTLNVFAETGEFKYDINLYAVLDGVYHPRQGFYHMSQKEEGIYKLTLSIGSTLYSTFNNEFYEKTNAIAQFVIDGNKGKVVEASTKLPLSQFNVVKAGLANRTISWGGREAIFREYQGRFFLTFPFSKTVYIYNDGFEQVDQLVLKTLHLYDPGFSFSMQPTPEELYDRTYLEFRAYLENSFIKNMQIMDSLLIVQYQAPLNESEYLYGFPTKKEIQTQDNWEDFFVKTDQTWLIYDLKTKREKLIRLSKEHDLGTFLSDRRMLVTKEIPGVEDAYIFKYDLQTPISEWD